MKFLQQAMASTFGPGSLFYPGTIWGKFRFGAWLASTVNILFFNFHALLSCVAFLIFSFATAITEVHFSTKNVKENPSHASH